MALVWVDGFDTYGTTIDGDDAPSGILSRKYTRTGTWRIAAPRLSGNGYGIYSRGGLLTTPVLTTDSKLIVGFGHCVRLSAYTESDIFFEWFENATRRLYASWHARTSALQIWLDKASDVMIGEIIANWYRWQYIEIALDTSAGTYEARLNGEVVDSASSLTFDSINNKVRFGSEARPYYDDLYVCDGVGTKNNDFLGPRKVVTIRPTADVGGYQDWTPSTGADHYAVVDEDTCNDDTDYVSETDTDETDLFEVDNVSSAMSGVNGVVVCADTRKETGDSNFNLRLPIKLNATVDEGSSIVVAEDSYTTKYRISEDKPGSGDWTPSDVDSMQVGVKVPS